MSRLRIALLIMIVACWGTSRLAAHPGGHGNQPNDPRASRHWTLAESGLHLHGTFITAKDRKSSHPPRQQQVCRLNDRRIDSRGPALGGSRQAEIKRLNEQPAAPNTAPLRGIEVFASISKCSGRYSGHSGYPTTLQAV